MRKDWSIDGKKGKIMWPEGEVVYQTRGVVVEPIYEEDNGKGFNPGTRYIQLEDGSLREVTTNPFNGYCYRQDGL